jgi:EAL domain-containing protein (putative c-di-GMP-specific phosphodiesterase class I)
MEVVAEGVENEEQLTILRALNCNEVQGYLVARPQPAASIAPLLAQRYLFKEAMAA